MAVGQIGFHSSKAVKKRMIEKKENAIVNRLNKTKTCGPALWHPAARRRRRPPQGGVSGPAGGADCQARAAGCQGQGRGQGQVRCRAGRAGKAAGGQGDALLRPALRREQDDHQYGRRRGGLSRGGGRFHVMLGAGGRPRCRASDAPGRWPTTRPRRRGRALQRRMS